LVAQSQVLELECSTLRKIEDRVARRVVKEIAIGENYERSITLIRSEISRFSRDTVLRLVSEMLARRASAVPFGPAPISLDIHSHVS
jgi:hypothetical protein